MDLEMPVIDGWEATRRLKGNPQTRDIPIIALSAHALAGEREKALAAGCDEFDTKPIEFDRLSRRCGAFLRSAKMLRRACSQQLPPPESWAHDRRCGIARLEGCMETDVPGNSHCR